MSGGGEGYVLWGGVTISVASTFASFECLGGRGRGIGSLHVVGSDLSSWRAGREWVRKFAVIENSLVLSPLLSYVMIFVFAR